MKLLIFSTLFCFQVLFNEDDAIHPITFPNENFKMVSGKQPLEVIEIPFRILDNLIIVEAEIDQQKGNFIFDTGAPDLRLNSQFFKKTRKLYNDPKLRSGITGEVADFGYVKIREFKWANFALKNTEIAAFDMRHLEKLKKIELMGVIGYQIFKDFELLIDYQKYRLFLYVLDENGDRISTLEQKNKSELCIHFRLKGHIPVVPITIGNYRLQFGIDTGAEFSVLNKFCRGKVLKHFSEKKQINLWGAGNESAKVSYGLLDTLKIEYWAYLKNRMLLCNPEGMNKAYDSGLDGILGFDFLCRQKTAINYRKKTLSLWYEKSDLIVMLPPIAKKAEE